MSIEALITIVGAFGVTALAINAFFLKGIYSELNDVKIQMASMISNADHLHVEIARVNTEAQNEIEYLRKKSHGFANQFQIIMLEIERLKNK